MKKAAAIAALALGLWGLAMFVTAVQMNRSRIEKSAAETMNAIRAAQQNTHQYLDWPERDAGK